MIPTPQRGVILDGAGGQIERRFTMDEVIQAIKDQWIRDFHKLEDGTERDGYFVAGFVHHALIEAKVRKPMKDQDSTPAPL